MLVVFIHIEIFGIGEIQTNLTWCYLLLLFSKHFSVMNFVKSCLCMFLITAYRVTAIQILGCLFHCMCV